jgi:trans-aconitate methyltransferase
MSEPTIRFDDGAGYEQMMGKWSRLAGDIFLDWLQAPAGLHWLDIGCGNGAFTETLIDRCAPSAISGIDPSEGQLLYARQRPGCRLECTAGTSSGQLGLRRLSVSLLWQCFLDSVLDHGR